MNATIGEEIRSGAGRIDRPPNGEDRSGAGRIDRPANGEDRSEDLSVRVAELATEMERTLRGKA
jgi:hypothetical protein